MIINNKRKEKMNEWKNEYIWTHILIFDYNVISLHHLYVFAFIAWIHKCLLDPHLFSQVPPLPSNALCQYASHLSHFVDVKLLDLRDPAAMHKTCHTLLALLLRANHVFLYTKCFFWLSKPMKKRKKQLSEVRLCWLFRVLEVFQVSERKESNCVKYGIWMKGGFL